MERKQEVDSATTAFCWDVLRRVLCGEQRTAALSYLSSFLRGILPSLHASPSSARLAESFQKASVFMFDHEVLAMFVTHPRLLSVLAVRFGADGLFRRSFAVFAQSERVVLYSVHQSE